MKQDFIVDFPGAYKNDLTISFTEELDPVNHTLRNGQVWSLDLARFSSFYWNENSTILDVGGHIGTYSMLAACFTKNKVISIEASPENFKYLKENKENNGFDHWEIHNLAASNKEEVVRFSGGGPGAHVMEEGNNNDYVEVKGVALDTILENEKSIDFIKMDIEGYELNALDGLEKTINKFRPPILIECNGHTLKFFDKTPNDLFRLLVDKFGYEIYTLTGELIDTHPDDIFPFGVVDCLCIDGNKHKLPPGIIIRSLFNYEIRGILEQTFQYGNDDIKNYVNWYKNKLGI